MRHGALRCSSRFGGSMRMKLGGFISFGWSSIAMPPNSEAEE
jgi:hypothetical protein